MVRIDQADIRVDQLIELKYLIAIGILNEPQGGPAAGEMDFKVECAILGDQFLQNRQRLVQLGVQVAGHPALLDTCPRMAGSPFICRQRPGSE